MIGAASTVQTKQEKSAAEGDDKAYDYEDRGGSAHCGIVGQNQVGSLFIFSPRSGETAARVVS